MENREKFKPGPEIKREKLAELWSVISGLKFEDYEEFKFDGKNFLLLFFSPEQKNENGEAWFSASTDIDGVDIYLLQTLPLEEKKKKLFHEVVEAWAQTNGFLGKESHNFALEQEKIFFSE
jgi:hypothetical protein